VDATDLCPQGCYWECEHRPPSRERAALMSVHDTQGRALARCRECGDMFYDPVAHGREHIRMRQLGWLPERPGGLWR
jgi:hypothetical protein